MSSLALKNRDDTSTQLTWGWTSNQLGEVARYTVELVSKLIDAPLGT